MARGKNRGSNEINASSMADIAFLLLIFFLVTTTIDQDKGILHGLPPWSEEEPPELEFKQRNVLEILVNSNDQLLVEGEYIKVDKLKDIAKKHITNFGRLPNYSVSPKQAVISLKNDRGTSYGIYIEINNELKAAYSEVRNAEAAKISKGAMETYNEISDCAADDSLNTPNERKQCKAWKAEIKAAFPVLISEAEPVNFGK